MGLTGGKVDAVRPVSAVQLSYALAFGGMDPAAKDPSHSHAWFDDNPVGQGYSQHPRDRATDGLRLAQFEPMDQRLDSPRPAAPVLGLGVVSRASAQRLRWAGSYDKAWLDEVWPNLPSNFDERHFQSAAPDPWLQDGLHEGQLVELWFREYGASTADLGKCCSSFVTALADPNAKALPATATIPSCGCWWRRSLRTPNVLHSTLYITRCRPSARPRRWCCGSHPGQPADPLRR